MYLKYWFIVLNLYQNYEQVRVNHLKKITVSMKIIQHNFILLLNLEALQKYEFSSVRFSCSVVSDSLRPHGLYGILQTRILERVAFPFSTGSSQPRKSNWVLLHCRQFLTNWATREALGRRCSLSKGLEAKKMWPRPGTEVQHSQNLNCGRKEGRGREGEEERASWRS